MSERAQKGQIILLVYLVLVLLASVGVIAFYVSSRGTDRLPAQLIRFVLTVVLCIFLFRGSRIAKSISVVLFAIGGSLALNGVFQGSPLTVALSVGLAALYLSFAWMLLWSGSVNAFLEHQQGEVPMTGNQPPRM